MQFALHGYFDKTVMPVWLYMGCVLVQAPIRAVRQDARNSSVSFALADLTKHMPLRNTFLLFAVQAFVYRVSLAAAIKQAASCITAGLQLVYRYWQP